MDARMLRRQESMDYNGLYFVYLHIDASSSFRSNLKVTWYIDVSLLQHQVVCIVHVEGVTKL